MKNPFNSSLRPSTVWRAVGALCSGFILAAAFPPAGEWESAWVGLVPLILVSRFSTPRHAFRWGWLSGMVFWLISISWLLRLGHTGGPPVLVGLGWICLCAYCALYTAIFALMTSWLLRRLVGEGSPKKGWAATWRRLLLVPAIPVVWVATEYVRAIALTGFPWNALGISQYRNMAVIQMAAWGGVYAVSAIVVVMNTSLALTGLNLFATGREGRRRFRPELMAGLLLCLACWICGARSVGALRAATEGAAEVRIAAIQPAVIQTEKWDDQAARDIFAVLSQQTRLAAVAKPQLIVWPETALPGPLPHDEQSDAFARELAQDAGPILIGAMEVATGQTGTPRCWNSSFLYDRTGTLQGRYRKKHLVPFGEYIPMDHIFVSLRRLAPLGVSCNAGERMTIFDVPGTSARFATLICFEDVFPGLSREATSAGADVLINQTNDAWFDGSSGSLQHMAHAVFRCVENRRPMVRSANTGVTCHIDMTGKPSILSGSEDDPIFSGFAVYGATIPDGGGPQTVYTRFGDWGFAVPCLLLSLVLALVMLGDLRGGRHDA